MASLSTGVFAFEQALDVVFQQRPGISDLDSRSPGANGPPESPMNSVPPGNTLADFPLTVAEAIVRPLK